MKETVKDIVLTAFDTAAIGACILVAISIIKEHV